MTTPCNPCAQAPAVPSGPACGPTCADMLCQALAGYNAVLAGMAGGKAVVEVQFGEQKVRYESTAATQKILFDTIRRLHQSCGNASSAAVLGLGGNAGPISTYYGSRRGC
ncbi:MAG: hypothetical protein V4706_02640 [Pseudomonadota bacterium]